jgi:hypothetical protein
MAAMDPLPIELANVRVFDVLRNALSGELGTVAGVVGDKLDLVMGTGAIMRFKYGTHFTRVSEDEAIEFRAKIQALRRERLLAAPRKRRRKESPPPIKGRTKRVVRNARRRA